MFACAVEAQGAQMAGSATHAKTLSAPAIQVMAPPRAEPLPQTEHTDRYSLRFGACSRCQVSVLVAATAPVLSALSQLS